MTRFFSHLVLLVSAVLVLGGCSESGQGLPVGSEFPSLAIQKLDGTNVFLSGPSSAQISLISIRTLGCRYCESDFAELEKIRHDYSEQELQIDVVAVACEKETMVDYVRKRKVSFSVYVDPESEVMGKTNSILLPITYFVDSAGKVLSKVQGAVSRAEVKEILHTEMSDL